MKTEFEKCYAIAGHKFPDRAAFASVCYDTKEVFLGRSGRFGRYNEQKLFLDLAEAELWIDQFLKKQPDPENFKLAVVTCHIQKKTFEDYFKPQNFYLKIKELPERVFETRHNLRPLYLEEKLVLGAGNTFAKLGKQKWFESKEEVKKFIEQKRGSEAFQGVEFEIVRNPKA